jgi:hypothetical protein
MPIKADTRNKRTKAQIAADRGVIADMMIEGKSVYTIRDHINAIRKYNLSVSSIGYDMRVIQKEWVETYLQDINVAKAKELARIDRVEKAAWIAWEESKKALTKTEKEKVENEQIGKSGEAYQKHRKVRAKTTEQESNADKEFIKVVQWCVETRCKILGINAPQRYDISWRKQAAAAGLDPDKVKADLVDQFVSAAEKGLETE